VSEPRPWQLLHRLEIAAQTEWRQREDGWVEHRLTGLVMAWCPCGYLSGWVERDRLPPVDELRAAHPAQIPDDPLGVGPEEAEAGPGPDLGPTATR